MKMRIIFLVLVLFSFSSFSHASDENPYVTKIYDTEVDNGRAWANLDMISKVSYIKGLSIGMTFGASTVLKELKLLSEHDKDEASKSLQAINPKGAYKETVDYIDEIYKNPSYRILPIIDVYICMALEQNGKVNKNNREEYLRKNVDMYK